jgi:hypothetical protein
MPALILNFRRGGLHLGQDLSELRATYTQQQAPAVLFYCGRVLEALASAAAEGFFGEATTSVAPNLNRLAQLGVLGWPRENQLQSLRRLAQDATLARRQVHRADIDTAVLLLGRLLTWYFVELETGPRLPTLGPKAELLGLEVDEALISALGRLESDEPAWRELPKQCPEVFVQSPVLVGLYCERQLSGPQPPVALVQAVLEGALRSFPWDVRLRQLLGDALLATGDVAGARRVWEDLDHDHPADPDTLRRLGHLYRKTWLEVPVEESEAVLRRALHCYQQAWSRSRETDNESGVHAAVLGLHRGRAQRAEAIAQTVIDSYRKRWLALGSRFRFWGFEDRVALAHCALILGETEYARRRYLEAFELPAADKHEIALVKRQLKVMLGALDLRVSATRFLEGQPVRRRRSSGQQLELPLGFDETERQG